MIKLHSSIHFNHINNNHNYNILKNSKIIKLHQGFSPLVCMNIWVFGGYFGVGGTAGGIAG